jgi:transcriptional regulator with XRE-family HTH domain
MDHMELHDIMRRRRAELNMSQAELAARVGMDKRQIRRYEAGETQPTLPIAKAIATALDITIDELAGEPARRIDLTGEWWACWQTFNGGDEVITYQEMTIRQQGDRMQIAATSRGNVTVEEGGYLWDGELRLWDNEVLMGWYGATDGAVRSKGSLFYIVHPHGVNMTGRWVGLSYDGPIVTGWATIAKTEEEARSLMSELCDTGKASAPA